MTKLLSVLLGVVLFSGVATGSPETLQQKILSGIRTKMNEVIKIGMVTAKHAKNMLNYRNYRISPINVVLKTGFNNYEASCVQGGRQ